jgi:hypothetical protein
MGKIIGQADGKQVNVRGKSDFPPEPGEQKNPLDCASGLCQNGLPECAWRRDAKDPY